MEFIEQLLSMMSNLLDNPLIKTFLDVFGGTNNYGEDKDESDDVDFNGGIFDAFTEQNKNPTEPVGNYSALTPIAPFADKEIFHALGNFIANCPA